MKENNEISTIKNIGWSLGNACPYTCKHCYSISVREQGKNLNKKIINRIVEQITSLNVETVNLGGNEPWFTNGLDQKSLLPYILKKIHQKGIKVGITTSGITLINLLKYSPKSLNYINDIDISFDSPIEKEHNKNRGANIFKLGIEALKICNKYKIDSSIIMCAMNWNFNIKNLKEFVLMGKKYKSNIRFNILKPLSKEHLQLMMTKKQFYEGFEYLLNACKTIDITEPRLATLVKNKKQNFCPCGNTSLRIHSITKEGKVFVSPCVYLHDFKEGDLLEKDLLDIIVSPSFKSIRERGEKYKEIEGCKDCEEIEFCGGGCAAQAYLTHYYRTGIKNIMIKEEDCLRGYYDKISLNGYEKIKGIKTLVHSDYLCTWIGEPK